MATAKIKGAALSKTVWLGLALTVVGYLQTQNGVWSQWVDPKWAGVIDMGFGLAVIVLRFVTTTSLAEKGNADSGAK